MAETSMGIPLADDTTVVNPIQGALNAIANAVNGVLVALPLTQSGTLSFVGNSSSAISVTVTFAEPYASAPDIVIGNRAFVAGQILVTGVTSKSATGFTATMAQEGTAGPGFGATYEVSWIASGVRA